MRRKNEYDYWILTIVLILLAMGAIMVFSASSYSAQFYHNNRYYFLTKQLLWSVLGVIGMLIFSRIDYHRIAAASPVLIIISTVMLTLVIIPGIGHVSNDARRWFNLGFTTFQPSEFTKIAMILFLSFSLSKNSEKLYSFRKGLLPYLLIIAVTDALLYKEPHMSAIILITLVSVIILFVAGAKIRHFLVIGTFGSAAVFVLISKMDYMVDRIIAFTDPFKYAQDEGFQVVNSLYAIASGNLFGRGLGRSLQKNLYIPEPHNDFIFSILCEELGFIGALTVIILFMLLIWRGIKVAMNASDMLGSLIAVGITSLVALEAIINIAVVTSTIPTTGMPLPFFSYGGTSTVLLLTSMGILLNVSKGSAAPELKLVSNSQNKYSNRSIKGSR